MKTKLHIICFFCCRFDDKYKPTSNQRIGQNSFDTCIIKNLKRNEVQSARAESTHKGVNQRWKYVTQVQKHRPESLTVTLTWHACKCKVHKLHQRYILKKDAPQWHI